LNEKNVREFETNNGKVLEFIGKLDIYKSTLARLTKDVETFDREQTNMNDSFINRFIKTDHYLGHIDIKFEKNTIEMQAQEFRLATKT
jgi:hypothetical protein